MNPNPIFLETAIKISERIINSAIWNGNKCSWKVYTPAFMFPKKREGKYELASTYVYQGVAGIGIYLSELYRIIKNDGLKRTLIGAANFCIDEAVNTPFNKYGFHNGTIGIAYFLAIAGVYLEDEKLLKNAFAVIAPIKGNEHNDSSIDVIGGAGGAIPALLRIYELTNNTEALEIALNLGEVLITRANKEPCGWSWGAKGHSSNVRNLCGFAHGAAGIGHAFLELYNLTKSDYYLYAAEQAFLYERKFYSAENKNWPDFRYTELSDFTSYQRFEELKTTLRNKRFPSYTVHYMSAWCHGAPGIGLSRLRAYELTSNETYWNESKNACEATINSLKPHSGNYSLCHGFLGNAETLLEASYVLKENSYMDIAMQKVIKGIELFEKKNIPWPCGTMGATTDPSLLVGEAGIAYFLLRIADKTVPSILAIKSGNVVSTKLPPKDSLELREEYINLYFSNILKGINDAAGKRISRLDEIKFKIGESISDVEKVYSYIDGYINSSCESVKAKLDDLFIVEKEKYINSKLNLDFSKEYTEKLLIEVDKSFDWKICRISLNPFSKLIKTKYNWDNITAGEETSLDGAKEEEQYLLLYKENNKINSKKISLFSFMLFSSLLNGAYLHEVVNSIKNVFEIEPEQINSLTEKIKEQIINAYKGNIIKISE